MLNANREENGPVEVLPNPALPQFPVGTQLALVRQMMLIDAEGKLVLSPLTESVQLRVYRRIPETKTFPIPANEARPWQDVFEFQLSRPQLFQSEHGGGCAR